MTAKEKYNRTLNRFLPGMIAEALIIGYGVTVDLPLLALIAAVLELVLLFLFFRDVLGLKDDGDHIADR